MFIRPHALLALMCVFFPEIRFFLINIFEHCKRVFRFLRGLDESVLIFISYEPQFPLVACIVFAHFFRTLV